jgi:predicted nucleic acid-binding protein
MAALGPAFFDTSLLVGGLIEGLDPTRAAQECLDAVAAGKLRESLTAWHCCLELFSVATRLPPEFRVSPHEALALLTEEVLPRFKVHQLVDAAWRTLFQEAAEDGVSGGRVYDAHLARVARQAGARLVVTDNKRHFLGLGRHGIRVLSAAELAGEL